MAAAEIGNAPILVRGVGHVGWAVAVLLFHAGHAVAIHDEPAPVTSRRGMAFTDAVFHGAAVLDGITVAGSTSHPNSAPRCMRTKSCR